MSPVLLFRVLLVALASGLSSPAAFAQEASSDIVGFVEVQVAAGKFEPIAPLLLPSAVASGLVNGVVDAGRITPAWFGTLPDPVETGTWLPRTGLALGRPLFGSQVAFSAEWDYSDKFQGAPFAGAAESSVLRAGDRFSVVPFWTVEAFAGAAGGPGVYSSANRADADTFRFNGAAVWAALPQGEAARWVDSTSEDPGSPDVGGSVNPDVTGHSGYQRSANATGGRALTMTGTVRASTVPFRLVPTPVGAVDPIWNPVFRPDGKEFTLANHLGIVTRSATTGLVAGSSAETADKLVIWSPDIQEWEQFYYQSVSPVGWKSLRGRAVNPTAVKVPSAGSFYVIRPSTLPELVIKLPAVSATVLTNTTLFSQIVDTDKDRMADGWERANGSSNLAMLPGADDDGDSLTNLAESLLGGNPRVFDHPARPGITVRSLLGGTREIWVTFLAANGCRYRVEKRLSGSTSWASLGGIVVGKGVNVEIKDPVAVGNVDRVPRFYRVVGLTPADSDGDLLSDWEEVNVYGADPAKADTDLDGTKDGSEVRTAGRNALDYYDGRLVTLTVDALTNGQVAPPGQWLRQAIAFRVTTSKTPMVNAPVTFAVTNGSGLFAISPGDDGAATEVLTVRTDSKGVARAFFKVGATSGRVQGRLAARVATQSGLIQLYSGAFVCHVSNYLNVPVTGLVRWFRPDVGVNLVPGTTEVASWGSVGGAGSAGAVSGVGPTRSTDPGRPWLTFTGKERLDMGRILPDNTFNALFVAVPTAARKARSASVSSSGANAGASGQAYLLAAETAPGSSITVYDPPAKPSSKTFSTWEITDFRLHLYYVSGPSGEQYWYRTRPYNFPVAPARYDITEGYRYGPAPTGLHHDPGTDSIRDQFVRSLGASYANWNTSSTRTSTKSLIAFEWTIGYERFYQVSPTTWKGTSTSSAYGGIARLDYARLDESGFGFSVGAASSGAFELRDYWKPATTGSGTHIAASGAMSSGGILGTVRVINQLPYFDVGGNRRASGASAYSKSVSLTGPRYIGSWDGSSNGFQGLLGDLLLYDRDLSNNERREVEDYLAIAYRGVYALDRDADGLRDWWERAFAGNSVETARGDLDGDSSNNLEEQTWGTDPASPDTDSDGVTDKAELTAKTNGLTWDTDFDLLPDSIDLLPKDPKDGHADAAANGIPDGVDQLQASRNLTDSDGDGLCDLVEAAWLLTNAKAADTDGDGVDDAAEVAAGTDPRTP